MSTSENNKRIAKNTLMLYIRMLITMVVGLFTSRVVLQSLGVEDYGIYNIVGGFVSLFSLLSGSLSAAISRFLTFELGKGNIENLRKVFSSAVTIQIGLSFIIVILAETVGLWFLNSKLVIPDERMFAAHCVYQLSILTFVISLISVPYNAAIIAHERMSAFAYMSILDVTGKLLIAYSLFYASTDRLILYGILGAILSFLNRLIYGIYCKRNFEECTYRFFFDFTLLKQMFGFAGWNFIGASSAVLRDQGGNIILNIFGGPAVNAARGIAMQVNSCVHGFVGNFMVALNPQITKSYASGEHAYMMSLIYKGARFSYYILLLLSLPIIINASYILNLWLGIVPEHTVAFVQLVLIFAMSESLANPLVTAMLATGKIRNYQLVVGGLQMMNLPLSYILLRCGYPSESVLIVAIFISVCCEMSRLYMLRNMIQLSMRSFLREVYFNLIGVSLVSAVLPLVLFFIMPTNFLGLVVNCVVCLLSTILVILYLGLKEGERQMIYEKVPNMVRKKCRL
ncbi:MAG: lipopolysaccharide biosynthesis protein [Bacteroidaceae bacterium]|nr:lipopolysaccharide biosynthesis protein [Bacteroidaceae bacterium]